MSVDVGWGGGPWGRTAWGGGGGSGADELELLSAIAIRENVVRLVFNESPVFTGILDPHDASNPARYSMAVVAGTFGMDGQPTRPVAVVYAEIADVPGSAGSVLDVTTDRGMSPFPSQYRITANNLYGQSGSVLDPSSASKLFYGVQRERIPALPEHTQMTRDLAVPFNVSAATGLTPNPATVVLGGFAVDDTGDVAFDTGLNTLKKRMLRRAFTRPGGFSYMPDYGLGLPLMLKRLNSAATRGRVAANAETQYQQEPEIAKVKVTFVTAPSGVVRMQVLGRTKKGSGLKLDQLIGGQ